jgi:HKD family nuclease
MGILTTSETQKSIVAEIQNATDSIQIISAFCKTNTVKSLIDDNICRELTSKKLLVRFRLSDILAGACDIDLYDYCKDNGWDLYIRFDLHAKTYIFDKKRCIVGSSNLTNSGLGIGKEGNAEFSACADVEDSDIEKIDFLFNHSLKVDDNLFDRMKDEFEKAKQSLVPDMNVTTKRWSTKIYEKSAPCLDVLFSYSFPKTNQPILDDRDSIDFLDCSFPASIKTIKDCFLCSNCYLWLKKVLSENNGCLYFGALAELLHNTLFSDPKPYRKDVKEYLANLLSWIEFFEIDTIKIDRPNYSQRVQLIK